VQSLDWSKARVKNKCKSNCRLKPSVEKLFSFNLGSRTFSKTVEKIVFHYFEVTEERMLT